MSYNTASNNQTNLTSLIYDPRHHTFDSWASLMCEAFAANQLEIPDPQTNWQGWASGLKAIALFDNSGTPDPYSYDDWSEWASALVNNYQASPQ